MRLPDLSEYLDTVEDEAGLALPIGGRTYKVRPPSTARGLKLARLDAIASVQDRDERRRLQAEVLGDLSFEQLVLGDDVAAQLADDDVPAPVVAEACTVAYIAWLRGEAAAELYVQSKLAERKGEGEADASGEASTPQRKPRQTKSSTSTTPRRGTRTASA